MTTIATVPVYPPPGRKTRVVPTLTESGSNWVKIVCTDAPLGSALRGQLDAAADPRNQVEVYAGPGGDSTPWNMIFDKGGAYTFVAQEYTKGETEYGGGYEGDPNGAPSETKVGSTTTLTLYIGQRMASTIRAGEDSVDLVVWVWNDTIRATTKAVHGENSPALVKESPSARELAAMESSAVVSAVEALADDIVTTALGSVGTLIGLSVGRFANEWNDHLLNGTVHGDADSDNTIPFGLVDEPSAKNLADIINEILNRVRYHYTNDAVLGGTTSGRDSGNYHNTGSKSNDNVNMPIVQSAPSASDAYWAIADLWRSYEAHRVLDSAHDPVDSTNTLTALPSMLQVALRIFEVWAATSPATPATMSSGAMALIAGAGFREEPLPAA